VEASFCRRAARVAETEQTRFCGRQKFIQQEFGQRRHRHFETVGNGRAGVSAQSRGSPPKKVLKTKAFAMLLA
jgi:hypothetical protein